MISKENLLDLIFEPGFSTAASVTEISGRGVGLDIVRSQIQQLDNKYKNKRIILKCFGIDSFHNPLIS